MATVFWPDAARLTELGFEAIAHVPVMFDGIGRYCPVMSRYLRERATVQWAPPGTDRPVRPAVSTLRNVAYSLKNFAEWCDARQARAKAGVRESFNWKNITYDHVLLYQRDQRRGAWAKGNRKLEPETANMRADEATHFLSWAAQRGLRPPFLVKYIGSSRTVASGTSSHSTSVRHPARVGREKKSYSKAIRKSLGLPTQEEVDAWLQSVRTTRGTTKWLACRTILEMGLRRKEVLGLTVDQWPASDKIKAAERGRNNYLWMEITITKGGRPRDVKIPIPLAIEMRTWIDGRRLRLTREFHKREGRACSNALLLSDARGYEGTPLKEHTLYDVFREVRPRPEGWSPHAGRHFFACSYILEAVHAEAQAVGRDLAGMGADWVVGRGTWHLKTLRRQLGHASDETTEIYLRWLISATQLAPLASNWHQFLETDLEPNE